MNQARRRPPRIRTLTEYSFCPAPTFRGIPAHPGVSSPSKHHLFNQPLIQHSWLLALQQRLSPYLLKRLQALTVPFRFAGSWSDSLSLYGVHPQPIKALEPHPPAISVLVAESTNLDLDPPTTLPAPICIFGDLPPSFPSLRLEHRLITNTCSTTTPRSTYPTVSHSLAYRGSFDFLSVPITSSMNKTESQFIPNIQLLGRSNMKARWLLPKI